MKLVSVVIDLFKKVTGGLPEIDGVGGNGEELTSVMTMQQAGFASFPIDEPQGFMLNDGQLQLLLNAVDPSELPDWVEGERFFYFDPDNYVKWDLSGNLFVQTAKKVTIEAAGEIKIDSAVKVLLDAPAVELGESTKKALLNEDAITIINSHKHTAPVGGLTSIPDTLLTTQKTVETKAA